MKLPHLVLVILLVVFVPTSARASIVIAYDDAADPTYNTGWAAGSNGGFGFGSWTHSPFGLLFAMGDSNSNGSLGGPGINVGGRAWEAAHQPNAFGTVAGRSLGSYSLGDSFEIDVDFGNTPDQGVAVIEGSDFCQVQATNSSPTLIINSGAGSVVTGIAYSDGGYRVRFDRISLGSLDVTITSLSSSLSALYTVPFTPTSSSFLMTLQSTNPVSGQSIFASRMQVTRPVPEPNSMSLLALGMFVFFHQRWYRYTTCS